MVGATQPQALARFRELSQNWILAPGVGAQGGDLALTVRYGVDKQGQKAIINSSRQITYTSRDRDFAQAARQAAKGLRDQINLHLSEIKA